MNRAPSGLLRLTGLAWVLFLSSPVTSVRADAARRILVWHKPPVVAGLTAIGDLPLTNRILLAIGLPLRNQDQLQELLQQLYDPASTNYHKFLSSPEFTARFGPTEQDYETVRRFAESNGLTVVGTHSNRVVLDVSGPAEKIGSAFGVSLRRYRHPTQQRVFFAPDTEPSVPVSVPVADMWGLSDYALPTPLYHTIDLAKTTPLNYDGTGPSGSYQGGDFRNAYAPGVSLVGAGQIAAVAEFDGYYQSDIATYEANCGYANVPLINILLNVSGTPGYSGIANAVTEVSLDIEVEIAMAPGLSQVMVYEGSNPYTVFSRIASDNKAKQISCSWTWSRGPAYKWAHGPGNSTLDAALSQMAAQGQSFFQASGDSDADTGSQAVNSSTGPIPVDSIYVTSVGGTSLSMNGSSWASEAVWNWGNNIGSSGGVSSNYPIPSWQTNVSMSANGGSTVYRNFPDVALTADAVQVICNNGSSTIVGGTSCAAPLWAGFTALVNQQAMATSGTPVGFLNPALYSIAAGPNYASCFNDITTGDNIGNNTPGLYYAVTNYDLATGLGTPNGANLINALAPPPLSPYFIYQPASQTVTNGATVVFSTAVGGQTPLSYYWLFNGTNLPSGGNIFGITSNVLVLSSVTSANAGSYSLVANNSFGSTTSSVATLTVTFPPSFATQPTNQTVLTGGNAQFSASVTGGSPISYRWRQNGTNLANGGTVSGATSNVLTLTSVIAANGGSYALVATNVYGSITSSAATLTVLLPATITVPPVTQTIQCGSNASFSVTATGTTPLSYQWSLDGAAIVGATTTSLTLANVHLPSHAVAVVVTNLYGSATSSVPLTVQDTLTPVITLNGANPFYVQLGGVYVEPGATANDLCAGAVSVSITGTVNTNAVGTNTVVYSASDGNGNIGTATRTVIVQDTTPPTILGSFTNLTVAANSNCAAAMPDVTSTNSIQATDLSNPLTITQSPTSNSPLAVGTNLVVITVADAWGNKSYSTNQITVLDQTPPTVTLAGSISVTTELGSAFSDPGATATDSCGAIALFTTNGTVNINVVGTNTLTYLAVDGSGNTNTATRTVIVQDTTPPTIAWSFTNRALAANSDCAAVMPDVTGTNSILATDLSTPLTITQKPVTNSVLPLGTNLVVITVADPYGNRTYSTNEVIVLDHLPVISGQPVNQTNSVGGTASFSVTAAACAPLSFQWWLNNASLAAQTNSVLTLSNLTAADAGSYSATVTSSGGSVTSAPAALTLNPSSAAVSLTTATNPSGFGDSLTFTAVVTPASASGTIQFLTNGAVLDTQSLLSGSAISASCSALPRGTNLITAIYSGDGNFLPASGSLEQVVTNHPPVVLPAFYTLTAGLDLSIAVADLATNWSDVDGDALFIAAIGTSTNGIVVSNTLPALYYYNSNYVNDQFVCTISDGFGGTNFQTVNITVVPDSTPLISVVAGPPGTVTLQLKGAPSLTYVLEDTTNSLFGPWGAVDTNTMGATGVWQFTDDQVTNYVQHFYRLRLLQ
jgi:subtilase family serine protease